jgi:hypothetical protein
VVQTFILTFLSRNINMAVHFSPEFLEYFSEELGISVDDVTHAIDKFNLKKELPAKKIIPAKPKAEETKNSTKKTKIQMEETPKKKKVTIEESESEEEEETPVSKKKSQSRKVTVEESDLEEEEVPKKKPQPRKKVTIKESESEEEEAPVPKKKQPRKKAAQDSEEEVHYCDRFPKGKDEKCGKIAKRSLEMPNGDVVWRCGTEKSACYKSTLLGIQKQEKEKAKDRVSSGKVTANGISTNASAKNSKGTKGGTLTQNKAASDAKARSLVNRVLGTRSLRIGKKKIKGGETVSWDPDTRVVVNREGQAYGILSPDDSKVLKLDDQTIRWLEASRCPIQESCLKKPAKKGKEEISEAEESEKSEAEVEGSEKSEASESESDASETPNLNSDSEEEDEVPNLGSSDEE